MSANLKPLDEQVVVLTGATSGIGLATARTAADRGARLVLAARSEDALRELTDEIAREGGDATYVVADVRDRDDVREIADRAEEAYGGFDTWVNVAGVSAYGKLRDVPVEDMRELFETNVWGLLYGSLEAADRLEDRGGAIINIGSILSERALGLQGAYSASKHAVKAFTDSLRMELADDGAPISVTLVKPSAIDTPYPEHAKNHMDEEASLPPPLYDPEAVAEAILHAAEHPQRDVTVGFGGKAMTVLGRVAPGVMDTLMETVFFPLQRNDRPARPEAENAVDGPSGDLEQRGDYDGHVSENSLYTRIRQRRPKTGAVVAAVGLLVAFLYARRAAGADGDADERTA